MMKEGMNKLDEELMAKFLMGECSEEELCKVNAWLDESDGNARELFRIEQIYHLGKSEEFADEKKIEKAEKQLFKRLAQEEAKRNKVRRLNAWMRYAAMFIGIFFISGLSYHIYQSQSEESKLVAVTARDEVKELMLPDGTKVWLNKHTTLKYPREFSEKGRNVYMEGEAYFEVAKDTAHPFIVKTDLLETQVLGTSFNIRVYSPDNAHVTLLEGSIKVSDTHHTKELLIKPGQNATLQKGGTFSIHEGQAKEYSTWAEGQFYFDDTELIEIMRELGRWYNVNIIFTSKEAMHYRMHFQSDRGDSLPQVLNLLNSMQKVNAKFENDKVIVGL